MPRTAERQIRATRRPRVFVVEDEPRLRALLRDELAELGCDFAGEAGSAEEAGRKLDHDDVDVLLLDLNLPGAGGLDLLETLRRRDDVVQAVVLTGFGDLESARLAIRLEVAEFLTKPFRLADLEQAMDRVKRRLAKREQSVVDSPSPPPGTSLAENERRQILDTLRRLGGNRTRAAEELGISRRTLYYRLSEYGQTGR